MSNIPEQCDVLIIGGGPGGAYSACCLAREGIDTVLLEADVFPRYHIGESMLPSMRHFLRFIDLDSTFDNYGFKIKKGGMFKMNSKPRVFTDFVAAGGPQGYTWNIVRSEADELMFKHAAQSGAKTFDGKLAEFPEPNPGRPTSARWSHKDGTSGVISFNYLVDASGRAGLNIASWGYWKKMEPYDLGGIHEDQPYFEALADASGWAWTIPLHGDVISVGVVRNQAIATEEKKKMSSPSSKDFYLQNLNLVPGIKGLMKKAELVSEVKSASDWSYSASSYASPFVRVVGDAGCFIDPFFSSGVHLAMASGLSAAATICASKKGDSSENTAADWHSKKDQDDPVLTDWDEETFDRAFSLFRPIIQGTVDVKARLTESEISDTINFCCRAFIPVPLEEKEAVLRKMEDLGLNNEDLDPKVKATLESSMSPQELHIMNTVRAREMLRSEDTINIDAFSFDAIGGLTVNLQHGRLGLVKPSGQKAEKIDVLGLFHGEHRDGESMDVSDNQDNSDAKVAVSMQA
ncbi:radH flavin-dependent halogenase [Penicillium brasilianum]|uniref:RadH flavin-dependent halogenase n=1 Tax=Penicillium brasilianum TaxID=104259 RepID=A0A1S9S059_PENBI|nr:radH flavin-dependent halogenase [Penicillium brasilianum]